MTTSETPDHRALIDCLTEESLRLPPAKAATAPDSQHPGLYAWTCDAKGRIQLGEALQTEINELIYAGQAGATKPGTKAPGTATLGSRIGRNHLGGNIRSSTLRKTLAACLRDQLSLSCTPDGVLDESSNAALNKWIDEHLSVTLAPVPDREFIFAVEPIVIGQLDPPLNLHHVASTASRRRLRWLRKALVDGLPIDAMPDTAASDSVVQQVAERAILNAVGDQLDCHLDHRIIDLPGGQRVDIDGVSEDGHVLVEAFARQGDLLGGQRHKVAGDILKLVTVRKLVHPNARLVLALASDGAAKWLKGNTWLAAAASAWDVEVVVAELDDELKDQILEAQQRQRMVNPSVGGEETTEADEIS